ncbi:MAG: sporulation peptidase YabG [Clostridia bacterium]|nr:sporulation peptidase YabG [Clostridia bacterium]MDD4376086.1 sporulation peptidase YabG [Clostridia bacterium]
MHMDGDPEYAVKCKNTYKKMGLTAYAYHVREKDQPKYVYSLLAKVRPNVLVITRT